MVVNTLQQRMGIGNEWELIMTVLWHQGGLTAPGKTRRRIPARA